MSDAPDTRAQRELEEGIQRDFSQSMSYGSYLDKVHADDRAEREGRHGVVTPRPPNPAGIRAR